MDVLSPAKLLVILVVALVVLGPDKLPKVARQIGGLWQDFRSFRQRLESDVRGTFPDLPSTETITRAVRSPVSFLDSLADGQGGENEAVVGTNGAPPPEAHGDEVRPPGTSNRPAGVVVEGAEMDGVAVEGDEARSTPGVAGVPAVVHRVRSNGHGVLDDPGMN